MELSLFSDYSLRVLMYTAASPKEKVTLHELAEAYQISQNHLVKVVHHLGKHGFLCNSRGRNGGIRMAKEPEAIRIGEVIRKTENNLAEASLGPEEPNAPRIAPSQRLKGVVSEAKLAFLGVLDQYTVQDLLELYQEEILTLRSRPNRSVKELLLGR